MYITYMKCTLVPYLVVTLVVISAVKDWFNGGTHHVRCRNYKLRQEEPWNMNKTPIWIFKVLRFYWKLGGVLFCENPGSAFLDSRFRMQNSRSYRTVVSCYVTTLVLLFQIPDSRFKILDFIGRWRVVCDKCGPHLLPLVLLFPQNILDCGIDNGIFGCIAWIKLLGNHKFLHLMEVQCLPSIPGNNGKLRGKAWEGSVWFSFHFYQL